MNKWITFYENKELSDVICEHCSKKSGKNSKAKFEKHQSLFKPPTDLMIFLQR